MNSEFLNKYQPPKKCKKQKNIFIRKVKGCKKIVEINIYDLNFSK